MLGPPPARRHVHIMVTMPGEAARKYELVRKLVCSGMDCMRINCAHDDATAWAAMIGHLRRAEAEVGRRVLVIMDLPGPKLVPARSPRPGGDQVAAGTQRYGACRDTRPRWLTPGEAPQPPPRTADAVLPLPGLVLALLEPGHGLRLSDARGRDRKLSIDEVVGPSRWASSSETAYVVSGTASGFTASICLGIGPPKLRA